MYQAHFGLHRQPFLGSDPARTWIESASVRRILPSLLHAIRSDLGFALLTGPAGSGKTALLRHLQGVLQSEARTLLSPGSGLNDSQTLRLTLQLATTRRQPLDASPGEPAIGVWPRPVLIEQLRKTFELWGPLLLLVDDAQLVPPAVLTELRSLSEETASGRSLLRAVFAAPLSFEDDLAKSSHLEFSQRIRSHEFLEPLTTAESVEFLARQIGYSGGVLSTLFTTEAIEFVVSAAGGSPRCLSLLADEALVCASVAAATRVDADLVRQALSRLRHLPYAWQASHLDSALEPEPLPSVTAMPRDTSDRNPPTGFVHMSGPSAVVEFGAPASATDHMQHSVVSISAGEVTADVEEIVDDVLGDGDEFHSSEMTDTGPVDDDESAVQFNAPAEIEVAVDHPEPRVAALETTATRFEVGRRFSTAPETDTDAGREFVATFGQSSDVTGSASALDASRVSDTTSQTIKPMAITDYGLRDESTPVDDRYTWIELGHALVDDDGTRRAELAGPTVPTSSAPMMAPTTHINDTLEDLSGTRSTTLEQIVVLPATDSEIRDLFTLAVLSAEAGRLALPPHAAPVSLMPRHEPVERGQFSSSPGEEHTVHDIRFLMDERPLSSSVTDPPPVIDELLRHAKDGQPARPDSLTAQHSWIDGHLLYGRPAAESVESDLADADPITIESESSTDNPEVSVVEERFYTLPASIRSLDVDLRSPLGELDDDAQPLIDSLTALQSEVASFQNTRSAWDHADDSDPPHSDALPPARGFDRPALDTRADASSSPAAETVSPSPVTTQDPAPTLVELARQRLESLSAARLPEPSRAVFPVEQPPAVPQSARQSLAYGLLDPTSHDRFDPAQNSPSTPPEILERRFSRLFTTLRQRPRRTSS